MFSSLIASWFLRIDYNFAVVALQYYRPLSNPNYHRSMRNFLSQTASFGASLATMYLASIVELEMQDCTMLLQLMALPSIVKIYPNVEHLEFVRLEI